MEQTVIRVPERGHAEISRVTWQLLDGRPEFWRLVERKIISVSQPSPNKMRLDGSCYVGRALVGDVLLEMVEKIDGALPALLGFATYGAFRVERAPVPASGLGKLATLLARQFLAAVRAYASQGRDTRYCYERCAGSLIGGRIDITRSLALRARGLRHRMVFDRSVVTHNTPKNRVVLAAIQEIERTSSLIALPQDDLAVARALALLFSDCRDAEVLFGRRDALIRAAEKLMDDPAEQRERDLLALASVILLHESFEHAGPRLGTIPRTWFLNLENLFETAVRRVLQDLCMPTITVSRGSQGAPAIFDLESGQFRADPDLVLRSGDSVTVGDVKYKEWTGAADQGDLYQLLVHAAAFGAGACFLVFAGDRYEVRQLGTAPTGCATWLFAVDVRMLQYNLRTALGAMGFAVEA